MFKSKFWQIATVLVSSYLMLAYLPELRILGFLILSLGLDTLFLLIGLQLVAIFGVIFNQQLLPTAKKINCLLEKYDPFFFIPTFEQLKKYPQMAVHSVPLLLTGYVIVFSSEAINDI